MITDLNLLAENCVINPKNALNKTEKEEYLKKLIIENMHYMYTLDSDEIIDLDEQGFGDGKLSIVYKYDLKDFTDDEIYELADKLNFDCYEHSNGNFHFSNLN